MCRLTITPASVQCWRRGWDLNPRTREPRHLLSRQALSTAQPPLRLDLIRAKNCCRTASASTRNKPETTSGAYPKIGRVSILPLLPTAPLSKSYAENTTRCTLARAIAAAHIGHGSRVTYRTHPSNRQSCRRSALERNASISACAVGSLVRSRVLCVEASNSRALVTTHPTGISPSSRALLASASARSMQSTSVRGMSGLVRPTGVEPVTYGSVDRHSIQLSYGRTTMIVFHFPRLASRTVRIAGQRGNSDAYKSVII